MERNARWMFCVPLFIIILLIKDIQAVKCYQCKAGNNNCNNPFKAWKAGVKFCEGEFCLKSTSTVLGQRATLRACSNKENLTIGCKHDSVTLRSTRLCICKTNLCNTSTKVSRNTHLLLFLMLVVLPFSSCAT